MTATIAAWLYFAQLSPPSEGGPGRAEARRDYSGRQVDVNTLITRIRLPLPDMAPRSIRGAMTRSLTGLAVLASPPRPPRRGTASGSASRSRRCSPRRPGRPCGLRQVRYLVPWDWHLTGQQAEVDAFMQRGACAPDRTCSSRSPPTAGATTSAATPRSPVCRAPARRAYRAAVRAFDDAYPWVRTYSAWNEVNHVSQPTFGQPAARRPLLRACCGARPSPPLPRDGGRRARHLQHAAVPAGVPARGARAAPPVGAAQLPGRQPPDLGSTRARCCASCPARCG